MVRELIKNDVPELWRKRAKAGLCPVCGKDPSEFNKSMRVYCSVKCREKYASKYTSWNELRDKIFNERGKICKKCGKSQEKEKIKTEKRNKELLNQFIKEQKRLLEHFRDKKLVELSKRYEIDFKETMEDIKLAEDIKWQLPDDIRKKYNWETYPRELSFHIDHIKAIVNDGDMWDEKNLQVLCEDCHIKKTGQDMKKRTKGNKTLESSQNSQEEKK